MKRTRYVLWLPLAHLAIMAPLISLEEAKDWRFTPSLQAAEDSLRSHPPKPKSPQDPEPQVSWDPDYEYRPSMSVTTIYTVEFPAALLISWCGHPHWMSSITQHYNETWCRLFGFTRVRTRIVFLDSLLLATICAQWWLIGWRLDQRLLQQKPAPMIKASALVITSAGVLAALLSRAHGILDTIALLAWFVALVAWVPLIWTIGTDLFEATFQRLRRASNAPTQKMTRR